MYLNFLDKIGDWNPQLLRELKGRLKVFNVIFAFAISLIAQLGLFIYHLREYPNNKYPMNNFYCNLGKVYQKQIDSGYKLIDQTQKQVNFYSTKQNYDLSKLLESQDKLQSLKAQQKQLEYTLYQQPCPISEINFQMWWRDHWEYIFITLCIVFIYTLLVAGTYLLVNNLAQEEKRGTLNFIRLSPQPETSILTGKMLGVPIVIYLVILLAVPLHIWSGISAQVNISYIVSFYIVLAASCFFFYSATLLFSLMSNRLSGFQPWLASGAVFIFLLNAMQFAFSSEDLHTTAAWLRLLTPFDMLKYMFPNLLKNSNPSLLAETQFFYLPLGKNVFTFTGLHLLNYGVGCYWIWQALGRRFRNPNATLLSKGQSYLLVAGYQVIFWGFTLQYTKNYCLAYRNNEPINCYYDLNYQIGQNFFWLIFLNFVLLTCLFMILSPCRQQVQDWARYRHQQTSSSDAFSNKSVWRDLIWQDKSPVIVSVGLSLIIITIPLIVWILLAPALNIHHYNAIDWVNRIGRLKAILGVAMFIAITMIYATILQSILLLKTSKRVFLSSIILGILMFVPPIILALLEIRPETNTMFWLFSNFPWAALEYSATTTTFMSLLAEFTVLALLNVNLANQVKLVGESATKALLAGR
ncbi:ABC transporter permease subunit [Nostoc sp. FACHB-87]|uniref:ABC transporter permease subunit n=1 Tax=Nostocales TaxID=1161 RepID=UPI00168793F9|nr:MULTISPECIES: ABC transporter permease subunit [Nostocales]MBD2456098.1 ABC transporter permease subunit [Nostoc sp. FACHB-87]MBD2473849.1 ABC transporter permease subunit [Anabaena sp. FACHB-83]MBD2490529.1 ABC transporter permease subunit [Aulosira sp. FACHB-615]